MKSIVLGARLAQGLTAAIVLGLSSIALKRQHFGAKPAATGFSAFVGGLGILAAAVGIIAIFVHAVPDIVGTVADVFTVVCFAIAGIILSVKMSSLNCAEDFTKDYDLGHAKAWALFDGGENEYGDIFCPNAAGCDDYCS
nr:hypothetical protein B0A51_07093 [Rachicladosporium sp. CCFEE 5018]